MVCIAGDIFDNSHPSAGAEALLYQTLKDLSANGERLVVLIAGNHDQPSRLEAIAPCKRTWNCHLRHTQNQDSLGKYGKFELTSLEEGVFSFYHKEEKGVFVCVPYLSEKSLNEVFYQSGRKKKKRQKIMPKNWRTFLPGKHAGIRRTQ